LPGLASKIHTLMLLIVSSGLPVVQSDYPRAYGGLVLPETLDMTVAPLAVLAVVVIG
jgi:hypothetical protein